MPRKKKNPKSRKSPKVSKHKIGELTLYNVEGKAVKQFALDKTYFDGRINHRLLHQAVCMYLANQRAGYACTKTRAEVSGSGRKPWRQKGTGRARVGSSRNPIWRGGSAAFGPKPRDFSYSLPKRLKKEALKASLNAKLKDDEIKLIEGIELKEPKTRLVDKFLKRLKVDRSALLILDKPDVKLQRATRNLPYVNTELVNNLNAYQVLKHQIIVFIKSALENLVKGYLK